MNELVYCIECGRMEEMKCYPVWGCSHDVTLPLFGDMGEIVGTDHELCYFAMGYTFVAPPELEEDWEYNVDAPGDDELLVMDLQSLGFVEPEPYFDMSLPEEAIEALIYHRNKRERNHG